MLLNIKIWKSKPQKMVTYSSTSNAGCTDFPNPDYWHKNYSRKGCINAATNKVNRRQDFDFSKLIQLNVREDDKKYLLDSLNKHYKVTVDD